MEEVTRDARFWREFRDRFLAEQALLKARYEEATRRHRAIMAAYLGTPQHETAGEASYRRIFGVPMMRPKRRTIRG